MVQELAVCTHHKYHAYVMKYLTANKIAGELQSIAKACHLDLTRDELMRFISHSGRVWVVVLLDEAGMNPISSSLDFLGWVTCIGVICKTLLLQTKHITALELIE